MEPAERKEHCRVFFHGSLVTRSRLCPVPLAGCQNHHELTVMTRVSGDYSEDRWEGLLESYFQVDTGAASESVDCIQTL